jgi:RND family efflux transporter MFP subunit
VDEKSTLIDQLRIDRPPEAKIRPRSRGPLWAAAFVAVLVMAGVAAWWLVPRGLPVGVATAAPAPAEAAAGSATLLDASGYVVARRQATVSSKITGKVVQVAIEEGQHVTRGEVIARLDDTNARAAVGEARAGKAQAEATLTAARVALDNATPTFHRNQEQFSKGVISAQEFDTAKAAYDSARTSVGVAESGVKVAAANLAYAERSLDDTVVRAPFAGVVTVKAAQEGEMVSPVSAGGGFTRTGIGTIVDMDSLEIEVDVSENFINRVHAGQPVTARLNAYPDWKIPAHVIAIIPTADRAKATVKVRVAFDTRDERILPEMGVRVAFLDSAAREASADATPGPAERPMIVPPDAVQASGETGVVFVLNGDRVERRSVRLGERVTAGQVVLSGLAAGTRLATGDLAKLTDGAKVKIEN